MFEFVQNVGGCGVTFGVGKLLGAGMGLPGSFAGGMGLPGSAGGYTSIISDFIIW